MSETTLVYAGFFRRLIAYLLDSVVVVAVELGLVTAGIISPSSDAREIATSLAVASSATWAYFAILESSPLQATLGKFALGIRVEDTRGGPLTFVRASVRYWSKILSSLTMMIGWVMVAFSARHQALHDVIAGSVVVRTGRIENSIPDHWDPSVPTFAETWEGTQWVSRPPD